MKQILKKTLGGLMIFMLIAAFGAVGSLSSANVVYAQIDEGAINKLSDNDLIKVRYKDDIPSCNPDGKETTMTKKEYDSFKLLNEIIEAEPVSNEVSNGSPEQNTEGQQAPEHDLIPNSSETDENKSDSDASNTSDDHTPNNIEVTLTGTEKDENGNEFLTAEVSWDADSSVNYNELYPMLVDSNGNAYVIPGLTGQTIGNAADVPEGVRYRTENGRNIYRFKVAILKDSDPQITEDEKGICANGLREGDTFIVGLTAVTDPQNWTETPMNVGAEVTFTRENAANKKSFK